MKNFLLKTFFASIFIICIPTNVFSSDNKQLITTLSVFDNDSTFHYQYIYDKLGNILLETKYYEEDGLWFRKTQTEKSYTGYNCNNQWERVWKKGWVTTFSIEYSYKDGKLISEIQNSYSNGVTNPVILITYQYPNSGLKTRSTNLWKNGAWLLSEVETFAFYPDMKTDSVLTSIYQLGNIVNEYLSIYTYNPDGTLNSHLMKQKETVGNWINTELINWFYESDSKQVKSQRNKTWITEGSKWENTQKVEYQHDADDKLSSETYLFWKTMFWVNDVRYDYKYDDNGLEVNKILSLPIYNMWRGIISIDYSNFIEDKANLMESKYLFWGGDTGELTTSYIPFLFNDQMSIEKGKSLQISYIPLVDTSIPQIANSKSVHHIPIYPNPSEGMYYVNAQAYGVKSWTVSDLNGRQLKNWIQSDHSNVIDITDLPKGVYVLRAFTPDDEFTEKLIKK